MRSVSSRPTEQQRELAAKLGVDISGYAAKEAAKVICSKQLELARAEVNRKGISPGSYVVLYSNGVQGSPRKVIKVGKVAEVLTPESQRVILAHCGCGNAIVKVKWNKTAACFNPAICTDPHVLFVVPEQDYHLYKGQLFDRR